MIKNNRVQLLSDIDKLTFAIHDLVLYLDTHPCDTRALEYYQQLKAAKDVAVNEYTVMFGPLSSQNVAPGDCWAWIDEPWPWEGGRR